MVFDVCVIGMTVAGSIHQIGFELPWMLLT
jgi:hypothetical protein